MTNPRSAGNAWAKIRNKLNSATADGAAPATPKKTSQKKKAATPKTTKADKADTDADADGDTAAALESMYCFLGYYALLIPISP